MPVLNKDMLSAIYLKLLSDSTVQVEVIQTLSLAGKEPLKAFESQLASAKSVYISGNTLIVKFLHRNATFYVYKLDDIRTTHLLKVLGKNVLRLKFTDMSSRFRSFINALCEAQLLQKLVCADPPYNRQQFKTICDACHSTLRKLVVPAEFYFGLNPQIFHLRSLYIRVSDPYLVDYLSHPACRAQELIIEITEIEGDNGAFVYEDFTRHILAADNTNFHQIKCLKLKPALDGINPQTFTTIVNAIASRFPFLENFILINQRHYDEVDYNLSEIIKHEQYYQILHEELKALNVSFSIELEWYVNLSVDETFFRPFFTSSIKSLLPRFEVHTETSKEILLVKTDELSATKNISFEINVFHLE